MSYASRFFLLWFFVMFERLAIVAFLSLKTTRSADKRVEIGLSVHSGISENQDGKIGVNSVVGRGSALLLSSPFILQQVKNASFQLRKHSFPEIGFMRGESHESERKRQIDKNSGGG